MGSIFEHVEISDKAFPLKEKVALKDLIDGMLKSIDVLEACIAAQDKRLIELENKVTRLTGQ